MSKNRLLAQNITLNGFSIAYPQDVYNWIAVGRQQWGVDYGRAVGKQINYPIAFSKFAKVVAVDGFNAASRYSKAVLYEEPSLAYFKFTYDTETDFVNYIAVGI